MKKFHRVLQGETLSHISTVEGVPIEVLKKINGIKDINKIAEGQKIYLNKKDALSIQFHFLDTDRNPIENMRYVLQFCGRVVQGITEKNGLTKRIVTENSGDHVKIFIVRLDGTHKIVGESFSGHGSKIVNIVSPRYRVDSKTQLDENQSSKHSQKSDPIYNGDVAQPPTLDKKELGPKVSDEKAKDGRPLTKVEGDISDVNLFLDKYSQKEISIEDIKIAAKKLKCKPGLIFAIAKQESSVSSFINLNGRMVPTILYERHIFRRHSMPKGARKNPYEKKYPDICGPAYKRTKKNKNNEIVDRATGKLVAAEDSYGASGITQYKRLLKAYQLNAAAALKACSWGKFQIMGFNYDIAGFSNVGEFVKAMSRNDAEHIKAFLNFAKGNKALSDGLQTSDFELIATGHNGAQWRSLNPDYAENLKRFYKEYVKEHGE
nr:N-acetylmuramidase domain-containing protein [uncultured Massilia sp.]